MIKQVDILDEEEEKEQECEKCMQNTGYAKMQQEDEKLVMSKREKWYCQISICSIKKKKQKKMGIQKP